MTIDNDQRSPDTRVYLHQFLDVTDQKTGEHLGYLSDYSMGGIMFITDLLMETNQLLDIFICDNTENEDILIPARVETVWIKPNLNPQLLCVGCKFVDIDEKSRLLLDEVGKRLAYDAGVEINREA